ncbi:hypothetical protein ACI2L1_41675 [Streptomyces sp. NPDC019531]|uniref:hypothetical protein n=1 Tax=Streptomyces sp. NPDC019531 TaxID=3365062 RepID=UPI0038506284
MGRRSRKRGPTGVTRRGGNVGVIRDRSWARELRSAVICGAVFFGALVLLDWGLVGLTAVRSAGWTALAVLLSVILTPPRVSAQDGGLVGRGLVSFHRVHTDRLVTVRLSEGATQRLVLSDTSGGRLELDPRVLIANPLLWHHLERGARRALEQGTLRCGMPVLERLGRRIDAEVCRDILSASDLV